MNTVKTWFVEAKIGKVVLYLTGQSNFTMNLAKARMFDSKDEAEQEFNGSPHFGTTPAKLQSLATVSYLRRRFPNHVFRAVCLDIDTEDRKNGLFHRHADVSPRHVRVSRLRRIFSLPGLDRLSKLFRLEA